MEKDPCRGIVYLTVLCDLPYLVSELFAILLPLHLVTLLMFFITFIIESVDSICRDSKAMGWCTAQWKMLTFCVNIIVKESRKFELARLKKKKKKTKKENIFAVWQLSGLVLSQWFF